MDTAIEDNFDEMFKGKNKKCWKWSHVSYHVKHDITRSVIYKVPWIKDEIWLTFYTWYQLGYVFITSVY